MPVKSPGQITVSMNFDDNNSLPPNYAASTGLPEAFEPQATPAPSSAHEFQAPPARLLPEDLRVPWGWADILLLVVVASFGIVVCGMLIVTVLSFFGVTRAHIQKSPAEWNLITVFAQILLDLGLLGYLAAQIRLRFGAPFWRTIGWRPLEARPGSHGAAYFGFILGGLFLGFMVSLVGAIFPPKGPLPIQKVLEDPRTLMVFMLTAVLVAPVVEETIFRGYLYPVVARSLGVGGGIAVTGTLFGLLHAMQLWGGWWQVAMLVVVGIVLTSARAATRTVAASYMLHLGYNLYQVIGYLIAVNFQHGLHRVH